MDRAVAQLATDAMIRGTVDRIEGGRTSTGDLRCPVNVEVLEEFVAHPMSLERHAEGTTNSGRTMRASAQRLLRNLRSAGAEVPSRIEEDGVGRTWVTLDYGHSRAGSRMVASGHILAAREMAGTNADPFKFGRAMRYLL